MTVSDRQIRKELIQVALLMIALIAFFFLCVTIVKDTAQWADEVITNQSEINEQIDAMQQELTAVSEAVEKWEGIR